MVKAGHEDIKPAVIVAVTECNRAFLESWQVHVGRKCGYEDEKYKSRQSKELGSADFKKRQEYSMLLLNFVK